MNRKFTCPGCDNVISPSNNNLIWIAWYKNRVGSFTQDVAFCASCAKHKTDFMTGRALAKQLRKKNGLCDN